MPPDFREHVEGLLRSGRRSDAVEYFFTQVVGVPAEFVGAMKADPSWAAWCANANTLPYDAQIVAGTRDGTPLPADRWSTPRSVEVVVGEHSEPFLHEGAQALVGLLPRATLRELPGKDHSAFWMADEAVADMIVEAVAAARR